MVSSTRIMILRSSFDTCSVTSLLQHSTADSDTRSRMLWYQQLLSSNAIR